MIPQILLSYATSECLEILESNVPNKAAQSHIDVVTLPSPKTSGSLRNTTKRVTFQEPLDPATKPLPLPWHVEDFTKSQFQEFPRRYKATQPFPTGGTCLKLTLKVPPPGSPSPSLTEATVPSTVVAEDIVALR